MTTVTISQMQMRDNITVRVHPPTPAVVSDSMKSSYHSVEMINVPKTHYIYYTLLKGPNSYKQESRKLF